MPSLMRFVTVIVVLAATGFASLFALATFVTPRQREMIVTVPAQRLKAQPIATAPKTSQTAGAEAGGAAATR